MHRYELKPTTLSKLKPLHQRRGSSTGPSKNSSVSSPLPTSGVTVGSPASQQQQQQQDEAPVVTPTDQAVALLAMKHVEHQHRMLSTLSSEERGAVLRAMTGDQRDGLLRAISGLVQTRGSGQAGSPELSSEQPAEATPVALSPPVQSSPSSAENELRPSIEGQTREYPKASASVPRPKRPPGPPPVVQSTPEVVSPGGGEDAESERIARQNKRRMKALQANSAWA